MYKKFIIISTVFIFVGNHPLFAKPTARSVKSAKQKNTSSSNSKNTSNTSNSSTPNNETTTDTTPQQTCQERFNECMDNVCLNDQGIRYDCHSSYDTFDTTIRDGNQIRLGSDLYTYAKGSCISILKSCDLKDRNSIENQYIAQIQTDFLTKNYLEIMAYTGEEAKKEALQDYIACMQPLCGDAFTDCFSITAVERRSPQCEGVLLKTARPLAVKRAFYDELEKLNKEFCEKTGGYLDADNKKCRVEVVMGKPKTFWKNGVEYLDKNGAIDKVLTRKYFNIGEIVECTQEYFATFYEENNDFKKGLIKTVSGATKIVGGAALTVAGAVATAFTAGAAKGLIGSGVKMTTHGAADAIEGYIIMDSGNKKGACYINNKYVVPLGQYFKVNFMI